MKYMLRIPKSTDNVIDSFLENSITSKILTNVILLSYCIHTFLYILYVLPVLCKHYFFFLLFPDLIVIWTLNLREYGKLHFIKET